MELVSSKKIEKSRFEFSVKVSAKEFSDELGLVMKKEVKNICIPGFRKGKAPKIMIEKYYGRKAFHESAINNLLPKAFDFVEKTTGVNIIEGDDLMSFEMVDANEEKGLEFKATADIMPNLEIGKYKGLEIDVQKKEVTEEDINNEIEKELKLHSKFIEIEGRSTEESDTVNIDFEGSLDGEVIPGGSAKNFDLKLGSKNFIPGFEEQLLNHNVGDKFSIKVRFPKDYGDEKLSDKDVDFEISINSIKEEIVPEFNLDFVKETSKFENIEDYKKNLEEKLNKTFEEEYNYERIMALKEALVSKLSSYDIPETLVNQHIDASIEQAKMQLKKMGLTIESYCKAYQTTIEEIRESFRPEAETAVKLILVLNKIVKNEKIDLTKEEFENEILKIAEEEGIKKDENPEKFDNFRKIFSMDKFHSQFLYKKAFDFVLDNSINISDGSKSLGSSETVSNDSSI